MTHSFPTPRSSDRIMCKAMNRSFFNVILGGFGADADAGGPAGAQLERNVKSDSADDAARSEEHTSDLQSLMRTSYAVFCLQKKTGKTPATSAMPRLMASIH